jgi:hypothetical protein
MVGYDGELTKPHQSPPNSGRRELSKENWRYSSDSADAETNKYAPGVDETQVRSGHCLKNCPDTVAKSEVSVGVVRCRSATSRPLTWISLSLPAVQFYVSCMYSLDVSQNADEFAK